MIQQRLVDKLSAATAQGLYRSVSVKSDVIDFASNDYLGYSQRPEIIAASKAALDSYGAGGRSSPLICGYSSVHQALEEAIASFLGTESALVINAGFAANHLLLSSVFERGDTVLHDRLNHASLLDGSMDSGAKIQRFRHNDLSALEKRLGRFERGPSAVVVEGVYSMDGDQAPLREISDLLNAKQTPLIVDDAHGIGVVGPQGRGSVIAAGVAPSHVFAQVVTFGKALGSFGAAIAGSASLINYLRNFGRGYIYSTAIPASQCAATLAAIRLLERGDDAPLRLAANVRCFKRLAQSHGIEVSASDGPIQPLVVGSTEGVMQAAKRLAEHKLLVGAVRAPTVAAGSERLRISLSAAHSEAQIGALVTSLAEVLHV